MVWYKKDQGSGQRP